MVDISSTTLGDLDDIENVKDARHGFERARGNGELAAAWACKWGLPLLNRCETLAGKEAEMEEEAANLEKEKEEAETVADDLKEAINVFLKWTEEQPRMSDDAKKKIAALQQAWEEAP